MERGIKYRMMYSEYPGHIVKIVAKLTDPLEGYGRINLIVVGGDGTMNEVLQGIIDFDNIRIGYIPTGSSNDFARALNYPKDPINQLENIFDCKEPFPVDIPSHSITRSNLPLQSGQTWLFFSLS